MDEVSEPAVPGSGVEEEEEGDTTVLLKTCLSEEDVGITAFANDATGFSGTLKERYSDFVVNEVREQKSLAIIW